MHIHNIIRIYEPNEDLTAPNLDHSSNDHDCVTPITVAADLDAPSAKQDLIVQQMWDSYVHIYDKRGLNWEDLWAGEGDDDDEEEDDKYGDGEDDEYQGDD